MVHMDDTVRSINDYIHRRARRQSRPVSDYAEIGRLVINEFP